MKKLTAIALAFVLTMGISTTSLKAAEGKKLNWTKENNIYYVLDENNEKTKGWIKDDANCWFFLDYKTGAMKTGWAASDATTWYYLGGSGVMQSGWQTIDGNKYYFETSGAKAGAMITGTKEIDGTNYNFGTNGVLVGVSNKGEPMWSNYTNVDKNMKLILDEIIKPGMSETQELRAIHDWVVTQTEYGRVGWEGDEAVRLRDGEFTGDATNIFDSGFEKVGRFYMYANHVFTLGRGVCDEYARAVAALADALGYRTSIFRGYTESSGHEISAIWLDGEWKILDAQIDDSVPGKILDIGFLVAYDKQTYFTLETEWINMKSSLTQTAQADAYYNRPTDYYRYNK